MYHQLIIVVLLVVIFFATINTFRFKNIPGLNELDFSYFIIAFCLSGILGCILDMEPVRQRIDSKNQVACPQKEILQRQDKIIELQEKTLKAIEKISAQIGG